MKTEKTKKTAKAPKVPTRAAEFEEILLTLRREMLERLAAAEVTPIETPRQVVRRRVTRIEALAERAARFDLMIDARSTPRHIKEIRFLHGDEERFVAHGITQAETWLAGFVEAKKAA